MQSPKDRARQWVRSGVKAGTIVKPARCQEPSCSNPAVDHHHYDGYEYYRRYRWVCRQCHNRLDPPKREKGRFVKR